MLRDELWSLSKAWLLELNLWSRLGERWLRRGLNLPGACVEGVLIPILDVSCIENPMGS